MECELFDNSHTTLQSSVALFTLYCQTGRSCFLMKGKNLQYYTYYKIQVEGTEITRAKPKFCPGPQQVLKSSRNLTIAQKAV